MQKCVRDENTPPLHRDHRMRLRSICIVDFSGGPRTNDQVEPAFHHSYPVSFYLEILQAFPIANVIDLTPGEGALAFAAHQRNIKYWGLTFNERHQCLLRERLDVLCLQCMLEEGHPLLRPRGARRGEGWRSPAQEASSEAQGCA